MKNCRLIIVLMCLIVQPVDCIPRKIKSVTTKEFYRTGEAIALDNLIQIFEEEHENFYEEEIKDGYYSEWSLLDNKNLSDYCKEYLGHCVATRETANATGIKIMGRLNYEKKTASTVRKVVVVQCKVMYKTSAKFYYMTNAPKPNCVYSLKCIGHWSQSIFSIINKHCDFEGKLSINNSLKRKRERKEIVDRIHRESGQPIAKNTVLLKYELEHQELLKMDGKEGKCIEWQHAMKHHNLDIYCCQYMKECVPNRNRKHINGSWKMGSLNYQKLNSSVDINITLVTCDPHKGPHRRYYMTRALEANCAFALLRKGYKLKDPFVIIFKHCGFEDLIKQQISVQDYDFHEKNKIPKTEFENEAGDALATLQLFPED